MNVDAAADVLAGGLLARDEINPVLNGTLPGDYGYDPLGLGQWRLLPLLAVPGAGMCQPADM